MELWKDIKGYEGLYQVSNEGRVKSLNYKRTGKEKTLCPKKHNKGYLQIQLMNGDRNKTYTIHRLVAEAFIENPNNYPCVNHKDEDKQNNNVDNLEWCTQKYNMQYYYIRNGVITRNHKCTKWTQKVVQLDNEGNAIRYWDNVAQIVKENRYNNTSIVECCNGKRKSAYGYKWEFAT